MATHFIRLTLDEEVPKFTHPGAIQSYVLKKYITSKALLLSNGRDNSEICTPWPLSSGNLQFTRGANPVSASLTTRNCFFHQHRIPLSIFIRYQKCIMNPCQVLPGCQEHRRIKTTLQRIHCNMARVGEESATPTLSEHLVYTSHFIWTSFTPSNSLLRLIVIYPLER